MKIASHAHPRDGRARIHTVHGIRYVFAPEQDRAGVTHFVAEVSNADHAELFIRSGGFYPFGEDLQVQPVLIRIAPTGEGAESEPPPPAPPVPMVDTAVQEEAAKLLAGTLNTIGTAIGSVSKPAVILAALALEKAKEAPRKGVVSLLQQTIEGLRATGQLSDAP
jgi:hypothetical protein